MYVLQVIFNGLDLQIMGVCRKLITGLDLLVVSSAAQIGVCAGRRSDCSLFGSASCTTISKYLSEIVLINYSEKLNGHFNNPIVSVKFFYLFPVPQLEKCG